jgi:hypothetical protein
MCKCRRGRLLGAGLSVALVACGSGGDGGPEDPVTLTKSPALDGYLDSLCTFMVRAGAYPKKRPCAQGMLEGAGRTLIDLDSAITAGTVIYHPDLAAQCAAEASSLPCIHADYDTLWNDCLLAFEATVAADGTCYGDFGCQAGLTCNGACAPWEVTSCCSGTCTPKSATTSPKTTVFVKDGESCKTTGTLAPPSRATANRPAESACRDCRSARPAAPTMLASATPSATAASARSGRPSAKNAGCRQAASRNACPALAIRTTCAR